MKAIRLTAANVVTFADVPDPSPARGEVVVALVAAALNHRDLYIRQGVYAGVKFPLTPGSDGAGVVERLGPGVDPSRLQREVIMNPALGWGSSEAAAAADFSILGLPRDGTWAEKVLVPVAQLAARPPHLSWEQSAALPLAGLTAYRALFARARLQAGERVLVNGVGGGVAWCAVQFAVALGAEVWVTSSSPEKIAAAVALGARGGFDYRDPAWVAAALARCPGGFAVVLDSAGGPGFAQLIEAAAPGGRVVFYGATHGNVPEVGLRKIFWRQLSLLGTTMGSPRDFQDMLAFVNLHRIVPGVSATFPLERAAEALELMERGGQCGKIVLKIR